MDLDRFIAENVFGWFNWDGKLYSEHYKAGYTHAELSRMPGVVCPPFSTDIAQAFEVVERMRELGYVCDLHHFSRNKDGSYMWECIFDKTTATMYDSHGCDNNPATAICLAAKAALEDK